jgi:2-dehydro-3-deoxyglucarate aldolase
MKRIEKVNLVRTKLQDGKVSMGSWMQIPNPSVAEIMGDASYDWIAIDMEHGAISISQLPDMIRALDIGSSLPIVRLAQGEAKDCKQALDSGAGGVIVPMIESKEQLAKVRDMCCWPPMGRRGVGFSRANLFGKYFEEYKREAQAPLLVAQIESVKGARNLEEIIGVDGLDAILIGPYDLSASMGIPGQFGSQEFKDMMDEILRICHASRFPAGMHIVMPDTEYLNEKILEGFKFIAYSIDAIFLYQAAQNPNS